LLFYQVKKITTESAGGRTSKIGQHLAKITRTSQSKKVKALDTLVQDNRVDGLTPQMFNDH